MLTSADLVAMLVLSTMLLPSNATNLLKSDLFPQTKSEVVVFPSQHLALCRESKEIALYESGFATRSLSLSDLATSGCNCSENDL